MTLLLALTFASSLASTDGSQVRVVRYGDDRLSGTTAVDVVVQELGPEACRLSQGALQETAVTALRAAGTKAGVSAKASSWFYTVYVRAESSEESGRCVTSLTAELAAQVQGIPGGRSLGAARPVGIAARRRDAARSVQCARQFEPRRACPPCRRRRPRAPERDWSENKGRQRAMTPPLIFTR